MADLRDDGEGRLRGRSCRSCPEDKPEDEGEEEKTPEARMNKARSMVSNLLGKKKEG